MFENHARAAVIKRRILSCGTALSLMEMLGSFLVLLVAIKRGA